MYLKSLELIGFKSFAQRTLFQFQPGVTAIVGPNGCGKSNVLDAIRWVLGEQSAKALRGGEMADVIFNGTDSKPPLSLAEVSLTFADCEKDLGVEWHEVQITRRVFRDGKSEYFLNKTPCRLRDIQELFMDTGVGRNTYSIMEQGKIDQILSSHPEDRRTIFEEAAGITKYKSQKKEALRKLEYTEANLIRVQDIMKEVNRQIGSLQRQAAKARRFQSLLHDLKTLDLHLCHKQSSDLTAELQSVQARIHQNENDRSQTSSKISEIETSLESHRQQAASTDEKINSLRSQIQNLKNQTATAENRITINSERIQDAQKTIERCKDDMASAEIKISEQNQQIAQTDRQIAQMLDALKQAEQNLAKKEESFRNARAARIAQEDTLRKTTSEISRIESKISSLQSESSTASHRIDTTHLRIKSLHSDIQSCNQQISDTKINLEKITASKSQVHSDLENARADLELALEELQTAQTSRQQAESDRNETSKKAASVESRIELLRQLQKQGEGLNEGTQALLRGLDQPDLFLPVIAGTLVDQIRVAPHLIPAIETALGQTLQTLLFKDENVTLSAAKALSSKKCGQAALCHRNWPSPPSQNPITLPEGALAWAADCIEGSSEGATLARSLLYATAITKDLDTAFEIKSHNPSLALVTLSGELITQSGIVFSGSKNNSPSQSVLARKLQIETLNSELSSISQKLLQLETDCKNSQKYLETAQQRVTDAREAVQTLQVELHSLETEENLTRRLLRDLENRRNHLEHELQSLSNSLESLQKNLETIQASLSNHLTTLDSARNQQVASETAVEQSRLQENAASDDLNSLRVSVATQRQQHNNLSLQLQPLTERISELKLLIQNRHREIEQATHRIQSLQNENITLQSNIQNARTQLETLEHSLSETLADRQQIAEHSQTIADNLRKHQAELLTLQEQKGHLDVRSAQLMLKLEHLSTRVSQRYSTSLETFQPDHYALISTLRERIKHPPQPSSNPTDYPAPTSHPTPPQDPNPDSIPWHEIETLVAELSARLDSIGPVNLDAIQEYDELEQRKQFLGKQYTDLINSKDQLLEIISRINRTTRELFSDTFTNIRNNFQTMFSELFGGGSANLILLDEKDPLESGIEIIAKPPGKQLKSVSLLSGGERTMTAVALLFAIYMVKPSPFCVLDEMDAPLDESNISRFIKILDRFVAQSQFVVITHNKRTISRAEMLYGVTMEEQGISKLVSVKFQNQAPPPNSSNTNITEALRKPEHPLPTHSSASAMPELATPS